MEQVQSEDDDGEEPHYCKSYRQAIGSLMYLMIRARPDLTIAVEKPVASHGKAYQSSVGSS